MTYRELLALLSALENDKLDDNVTIFIDDEYFPVESTATAQNCSVLDDGHFYLKGSK